MLWEYISHEGFSIKPEIWSEEENLFGTARIRNKEEGCDGRKYLWLFSAMDAYSYNAISKS